jgi:hypothetical protein
VVEPARQVARPRERPHHNSRLGVLFFRERRDPQRGEEPRHEVLFEASRQDQDDDEIMNNYKLLSCGGCGTVCLMHKCFGISDDDPIEDEDEDNLLGGTYGDQ